MDYTKFINSVLENSSKIALKYYGKISGVEKSEDSNQVFTQADFEIGKFIAEKIKEQYPKHNIIDEEIGIINNKSVYTWVVDPIDGTSNFVAGIPLYGVMVGLLENDKVLAGGISLPAFSEIYTAQKSKGAYCNGVRLSVTKETNLKSLLVAYGIDSNIKNPNITRKECKLLAEIVLSVRNIRISNSCFDLVMVARGNYGGILNRSNRVWDTVAPQAILEEAGALCTDFYGKQIDYSNHLKKTKENFPLFSASPILHKKLQDIILKTGQGRF